MACLLLLLLALAAQPCTAERLTTNDVHAVLKCVYNEWHSSNASNRVTAVKLEANMECCKSLLVNGTKFTSSVWSTIINYTPLTEVSQAGNRSVCDFGETVMSIPAHEFKDFVCKISEEYENISPREWLDNIHLERLYLSDSDLRKDRIRSLLQYNDRIVTDAITSQHCYMLRKDYLLLSANAAEAQRIFLDFKNMTHSFLENHMRSISLAMKIAENLYVPYAYDHLGETIPEEHRRAWITTIEKIHEWLHVRIRAYIRDKIKLTELIHNANLTENPKIPAKYTVRWPYPTDLLLSYGDLESARNDCIECCISQTPEMMKYAEKVAEVAENFYNTWLLEDTYAWITHYMQTMPVGGPNITFHMVRTDEMWPLEDQSNTTVSVDTSCVQLMMEFIDNPKCFIDEVATEARLQQENCRLQLQDDLLHRATRVPVNSYLVYSQKVNVNLCLLSWMITNSNSICRGEPPSFSSSAAAAHCLLSSSVDPSCQYLNLTDAVCSISREILWFKCEKYVSLLYGRELKTDDIWRDYGYDRNSFALKYKNFTVDYLLPLEIALISLNMLFRLLTAGVYICLTQLRNVRGKLLLGFQITGIIQVFCTEVIYRYGGIPDVTTAAQLDSSLTLLSCTWLITFNFEILQKTRAFRLPEHLHLVVSKEAFRCYVICALIPWIILSSVFIALERTNEHYVFHSRLLFLVAVTLTVASNLFFLCLIAYKCLRSPYFIRQLNSTWVSTFSTKKQLIFLVGKTFVLSGAGIALRLGIQQMDGVAQWIYCFHLATMFQGPLLFVLFICDDGILRLLKERVLSRWYPDLISPGQELRSSVDSMGKEILSTITHTSM